MSPVESPAGALIVTPRPVASTLINVASQLPLGLVTTDGHLHAVQKKLAGSVARCGAGRILNEVPGRFDASDERACPACAELVAADAEPTRGLS